MSSFTDAGPSLLVKPAYPVPGETVNVSIDNFLSSSYGAEITWYINGKEIPDTKNVRDVQVDAGTVGSKSTVSATLKIPNRGTQEIRATIQPLYLDVIVEPQTHVPATYLGRALPSTGSVTNLIALTPGNSVSSSDLVYTWRVNDKVLGGGGGRGQNQISFDTPQGSQIIVSLNVARLDGSTLAARSFTIPSVKPLLRFYEKSTLYGVIYKPLSSFNLIGNSATVVAEPYFLDSRVYNYPDIKTWSIDNRDVGISGNPYEITIERVDYNGTSNLGFHVRSLSNLLQGAQNSLKINY